MDNSHREAFELLGLDTNANADEINKKYRQLARGCHPDKPGGDDVMIRKYNEARDKAIAYVQGNSGLGTGGGASSADSGCNEDWERRWFAQQTEFFRMEEANRQLREQNDAKDAVIRGVELKLEETVAELDQKVTQLVRSERERAGLEEKLQTLQASLDGEEQRAEIAENRAKEWEQKYNETQASQQQDKNKKKRKVNDSYQPLIKYDEVITRFINEKLEEDAQETSNMLTTRDFYESFLESSEGNQPTYIHFSREISNIMPEIFPSVRHVRNSCINGYMGIKMIAHD